MDDPSGDALAPFRLDGKVALITGAASGLGRATAELFAAVGASVIVADLDGAAAAATAAEIAAIGPAFGVAVDVADEAAVRAAFAAAAERFGGVDILVNNAAYRLKAATMDMPVEEWDRMHAVNARGTFLCLR
ncbi:SDR family NAD(P)-dependent oxidoreductase, partial [Phenylobacterium sp.]|uniref:SDR family NAD(P)-dependent oxidoreductase n=1 Tax=Phenylobacterium sp. TaxID=1871053 RepID=UPI002ED9A4F9